MARPAIIEVVFQRLVNRRKSELGPGYLFFREQTGLKAFRANPKTGVSQSRNEEHVDLADVRQIEDRIKTLQVDRGVGFLKCLAAGSFKRCFAVLHETGRKRPIALAWLDGAAAKQHGVSLEGQCTGNDAGVLIMNMRALRAYVTLTAVAVRNGELYGVAALAAEFHWYKAPC